MKETARLRRDFCADLAIRWSLRDPAWRKAVEKVPREVFLGERVYRNVGPGQWSVVPHGDTPAAEWADMAYSDETWVTQLNNGEHEPDQDGTVTGVPTSSSTLPGVVVAMLEDLQVAPGMRVLEIGTGSGYSTALLCERLGERNVTSIEVDPGVARRAADALDRTGYHPTLINGDGLAGVPGEAFDRIIATCAVLSIPDAWLMQARPAGRILATLTGWLYGFALARATMTGPRSATGEFLDRTVSFMLARSQENPRRPIHLPDTTDSGAERRAQFGPGLLTSEGSDGWTARWLAQLALPFAAMYPGGDHRPDYVHDLASDSWAWLRRDPAGGYLVGQAGSVPVWGTIERVISRWRGAGSPPQREFQLNVHGEGQTVTHPRIDISWNLPTRPPGVCHRAGT